MHHASKRRVTQTYVRLLEKKNLRCKINFLWRLLPTAILALQRNKIKKKKNFAHFQLNFHENYKSGRRRSPRKVQRSPAKFVIARVPSSTTCAPRIIVQEYNAPANIILQKNKIAEANAILFSMENSYANRRCYILKIYRKIYTARSSRLWM